MSVLEWQGGSLPHFESRGGELWGKYCHHQWQFRGQWFLEGFSRKKAKGLFTEVAQCFGNFTYDRPHSRRVQAGRWEKRGHTEPYRAEDASKGSPGPSVGPDSREEVHRDRKAGALKADHGEGQSVLLRGAGHSQPPPVQCESVLRPCGQGGACP